MERKKVANEPNNIVVTQALEDRAVMLQTNLMLAKDPAKRQHSSNELSAVDERLYGPHPWAL